MSSGKKIALRKDDFLSTQPITAQPSVRLKIKPITKLYLKKHKLKLNHDTDDFSGNKTVKPSSQFLINQFTKLKDAVDLEE